MNEVKEFLIEKRDKRIQWFIFIMVCFGIAFFLFCDFGSYKNWFNCKNIVYLSRLGTDGKVQKYTVAQLMYNSDEYFLIMALTFSFWYATRKIVFGPYMSLLIVDLMLAGMYFCLTKNPEWGDWDAGYWVILSLAMFFVQLLIYFNSNYLKKFNLF